MATPLFIWTHSCWCLKGNESSIEPILWSVTLTFTGYIGNPWPGRTWPGVRRPVLWHGHWRWLLVLSWPFPLSAFSVWMCEWMGWTRLFLKFFTVPCNTHGPLICDCSLTGLFSRSRPSAQRSNPPFSPSGSLPVPRTGMPSSPCLPEDLLYTAFKFQGCLPCESSLAPLRLGVHVSMHLVSCICTSMMALSSGT